MIPWATLAEACQRLAVITGLFRWAVRSGHVQLDPTSGIKLLGTGREKEGFTPGLTMRWLGSKRVGRSGLGSAWPSICCSSPGCAAGMWCESVVRMSALASSRFAPRRPASSSWRRSCRSAPERCRPHQSGSPPSCRLCAGRPSARSRSATGSRKPAAPLACRARRTACGRLKHAARLRMEPPRRRSTLCSDGPMGAGKARSTPARQIGQSWPDRRVVIPHQSTRCGIYRKLLSCHKRLRNAWWARQDSNLQPDRYERSALTIELQALSVMFQQLAPCSGSGWQNRPHE